MVTIYIVETLRTRPFKQPFMLQVLGFQIIVLIMSNSLKISPPPTLWQDKQRNYRIGILKDVIDNNTNNILDFYHGRMSMYHDHQNLFMIDTILTTWSAEDNYTMLEEGRDFMYWLFPTLPYCLFEDKDCEGREIFPDVGRDMHISYKPIPTLPISYDKLGFIRRDNIIKQKFIKAYDMMLRYYGFIYNMEIDIVIAPFLPTDSEDNEELDEYKRNYGDDGVLRKIRYKHLSETPLEWSRITRILQSLGDFGFERLKSPWLHSILPLIFSPIESRPPLIKLRQPFWTQWIPSLRRRNDRTFIRSTVRQYIEKSSLESYPFFDEDKDASNDKFAVDICIDSSLSLFPAGEEETSQNRIVKSIESRLFSLDLSLVCDLSRLELSITDPIISKLILESDY